MKKSLSILLSFVLLAGHMSLTLGTHLCGGEIVEKKLLFNETHLGCNMPDMEEPCDGDEKSNLDDVRFDKVPCCENEFQTFQSTNEFVKEVAQTNFNLDFTVEFDYTTLTFNLFPKTNHHTYTANNSPPLEKDILVLFQTFLI